MSDFMTLSLRVFQWATSLGICIFARSDWLLKLGIASTIHLHFSEHLLNNYNIIKARIFIFIIQQIVTMPIYGKEALNICHPYMTDILRYT